MKTRSLKTFACLEMTAVLYPLKKWFWDSSMSWRSAGDWGVSQWCCSDPRAEWTQDFWPYLRGLADLRKGMEGSQPLCGPPHCLKQLWLVLGTYIQFSIEAREGDEDPVPLQGKSVNMGLHMPAPVFLHFTSGRSPVADLPMPDTAAAILVLLHCGTGSAIRIVWLDKCWFCSDNRLICGMHPRLKRGHLHYWTNFATP